jgi:hypothetical protein
VDRCRRRGSTHGCPAKGYRSCSQKVAAGGELCSAEGGVMILMVRLGEWDTFHDGCDAPATMVFRAVEDVCNGRGCEARDAKTSAVIGRLSSGLNYCFRVHF